LVKMAKMDKTVTLEDLMLRFSQWRSNPGQENSNFHPLNPPAPRSSPGDRTSGEKPSGPSASDKTKSKQDPAQDASDGNKDEKKSEGPLENTNDTPEDSEVNLKFVEKHWDDFIACLKKKKITIGSFMEAGVPIKLEADTLEIGFGQSNGFHIDAILRGKYLVCEALSEVLHKELKFHCVKGDYGKKNTGKPMTRDERLSQLRKMSEENGIVQKIVDEFDVEILE
jgi:hypothetical protein